ncbi:DUF2225 domain-containing protein [Lachnospira pectinoschiza]|uniref:DUF2225 domain-containing protein n=1 Tax=Lachnospira pectinoschiza TaxID=28052 RepID=A0A1G9ZVC4_9FIRM|nr:DUF2225 domain-containing protein [Lachnospira pectinoschiza]SDN24931.1 hypothetical protein SAMN05216544_2258 [Lachnospira pectinoschiza]
MGGNNEKKTVSESDLIFDKKCKCAACNADFTYKQVRTGKARFIGTDDDLRPRYSNIDTVKYDVIMCPVCGYSAVSREFDIVSDSQRIHLNEVIGSKFAGVDMSNKPFYTYDDAIVRYKMALLTAINKLPAKLSECAFLCLKLSWLYEGRLEQILDGGDKNELSDEDFSKYIVYEQGLLQYREEAYKGFSEALIKEYPPLCGMDEESIEFLIGVLAMNCGDYDEALNYLSKVVVSKKVNPKVKEKARDMMDLCKEKKMDAF